MPRKILSRFKRRNKKSLTTVSLPQQIIFNILVRLPARDIYQVSRHVCREWKDMTHTRYFIDTHLMHAPKGLIVRSGEKHACFVAMQDGRPEVSDIHYNLHRPFFCSCNGLLLLDDPYRPYRAIVANLATNQEINLPPFYGRIFPSIIGAAFAFVNDKYKVCIPYQLKGEFPCFILTIGVDKVWRRIDTQHLSLTRKKAFYRFTPLCIEGFIVWTDKAHLLALNLETEMFEQFSFPRGYPDKHESYFLTMGSNLSFVSKRGEFFWEVWEMKTETWEWTKFAYIDLEGRIEGLFCTENCSLRPVGWLNSREWLVFLVKSGVCIPSYIHLNVVYNIKTQAIQLFELSRVGVDGRHYKPHVNSLGFLDGQYK